MRPSRIVLIPTLALTIGQFAAPASSISQNSQTKSRRSSKGTTVPTTDPTIVPAAQLEPSTPSDAVLVKTNIDHVSIIEMPEDVDSFICGSEAIQVQSKGSRVVLLPTKAGIETNLIIWTKTMKQVYEVLPAGDPRGEAYIKTPFPPGVGTKSTEVLQSENDAMVMEALNKLRIIDTRSIKLVGKSVEVLVRQVTETNDSYYVRVALRNGPAQSYSVTDPTVEYLEPSFSAGTPSQYIGQLIPDSVLHTFGYYTTTTISTRNSTLKPINLGPRQFVQWSFAFKKPHKSPGIFRFTFPSDSGTPVTAVAIF